MSHSSVRLRSIVHEFPETLKIQPKGSPAGMVCGAVSTVNDWVGAAGDGTGIKDKRLVKSIEAD